MKETLRRTVVLLTAVGLLALVVGMSVLQTPSAQSQDTDTTAAPAPEPTPTPTPEPTPLTALEPAPTHRAQGDFGEPIGDAYLQMLLEQHRAKPVAAYMTGFGFFGARTGPQSRPTPPRSSPGPGRRPSPASRRDRGAA